MYLYPAVEKMRQIYDMEGRPYMICDRQGRMMSMDTLINSLLDRYVAVDETPEFNRHYVMIEDSLHQIVEGELDWWPIYTIEYLEV